MENKTELAIVSTPVFEPTKQLLRSEVWTRLLEMKCGVGDVIDCIPSFIGNDKAAVLLSKTEEFHKAQNVQVYLDHVLHTVKLQILLAGKTLYLPGIRDSSAVLLRVDLPEIDSDGETAADRMHYHRVSLDDHKVKLDMVVIGSVVVSRDGYRIGRGNGFADLDIGLLIEIGSITPETIIATLVHDEQVVDSLPTNLFQKYDTPVDLIVTPNEVIRVTNRLPRPNGIFWDLLSPRQLRVVPVLQTLKERAEKIACSGFEIVLKDTDTEEMQDQKSSNDGTGTTRRRRIRRRQSPTSVAPLVEQNADAKKKEKKRRFFRFFNQKRQSLTKLEGQKSGPEVKKSQERRKFTSDDRKENKFQRNTTAKPDVNYELSKATRDMDSLFILWKEAKLNFVGKNVQVSYVMYYTRICLTMEGEENEENFDFASLQQNLPYNRS